MNASQETCQILARLPLDLKQWLQHRAIDNVRSANSELVYILKRVRDQELTQVAGQ